MIYWPTCIVGAHFAVISQSPVCVSKLPHLVVVLRTAIPLLDGLRRDFDRIAVEASQALSKIELTDSEQLYHGLCFQDATIYVSGSGTIIQQQGSEERRLLFLQPRCLTPRNLGKVQRDNLLLDGQSGGTATNRQSDSTSPRVNMFEMKPEIVQAALSVGRYRTRTCDPLRVKQVL